MNKQSVVVVEDSGLLRKQFVRTLQKHGYDTHEAVSPNAAIDIIDDIKPSAIILDFMLSGGNALLLLHELISHEDLAQIPIILVTGLADTMPAETLAAYNVVHVLDKTTMEPDDIVAAIRRVM